MAALTVTHHSSAMSVLRVAARRAATPALARSFTVSAARGDLVKDLYINQLKAYKPPAKSADAHASAVRTFSTPAAPTAPQLPSDLAADMAKFDAQEPTLGNTTAKAAEPTSGGDAQNADQYLKFLEADLPKPEAH